MLFIKVKTTKSQFQNISMRLDLVITTVLCFIVLWMFPILSSSVLVLTINSHFSPKMIILNQEIKLPVNTSQWNHFLKW